jgi:hypothetical protein
MTVAPTLARSLDYSAAIDPSARVRAPTEWQARRRLGVAKLASLKGAPPLSLDGASDAAIQGHGLSG